MSVCETCLKQKNGKVMAEPEARIHKDNFPDHQVVSVDADDLGVEG